MPGLNTAHSTAATVPVHPILANDPASDWMGIEVVELSAGHATIQMMLRQEMLNGFGIAHGGMLFAFADSAFALACNHINDDGELADPSTITVASGVDINFLKPAKPGQLLTADAHQRHQAGRSGIYDIQILADGVVVAEFRGRSRTVPNPAFKQ
ncbi:hydroxyphenylacetyl-CoA thioesterase PaaI [Arthrobacter monumenti]